MMGYGMGRMDEKSRNSGFAQNPGVELYRSSPYEFCQTSEPCVGAGFQVAKSVVVSPRIETEAPTLALSVTFNG